MSKFIFHKAEYIPTAYERKLLDRCSVLYACNCSYDHDHTITPIKRVGIGAGSRIYFRNIKEPLVLPPEPKKVTGN